MQINAKTSDVDNNATKIVQNKDKGACLSFSPSVCFEQLALWSPLFVAPGWCFLLLHHIDAAHDDTADANADDSLDNLPKSCESRKKGLKWNKIPSRRLHVPLLKQPLIKTLWWFLCSSLGHSVSLSLRILLFQLHCAHKTMVKSLI